MNAVVETRGLCKQYGPALRVNHLDLTVPEGAVYGFLGPNGAGKSNTLKLLLGLARPTAGEIAVFGRPMGPRTRMETLSQVGSLIESPSYYGHLTGAENLHIVQTLRGAPERDIGEVLRIVRLDGQKGKRTAHYSLGMKQRLGLAAALLGFPRLLILDEPTAVLTPQEVEDLFRVMRQLKAAGKSIIIITHKLKETMEIADRVSVLRQGKMIESGVPVAGTTMNELAQMMVGRDVELSVTRRAEQVGEENFSVRGLSLTERGVPILRDVCLSLRKGEILGIAGIEGNGQTELIEVLTGLRRPDHMELFKDGKPLSGNAAAFLAAGVGHVPEDRMTRGLVLEMSIEDNLILGYHRRPAFARRGLRLASAIRRFAEQERTEFAIKAPNVQERCSALSGGNQQKVVIARVFSENPDVIIVAQPTRGVDVGAMEYIHHRLLDLRDGGKSILLISADLDEVRSLSDRLAVIYGGRIVAEGKPDTWSDMEIGLLMTGGSLAPEKEGTA